MAPANSSNACGRSRHDSESHAAVGRAHCSGDSPGLASSVRCANRSSSKAPPPSHFPRSRSHPSRAAAASGHDLIVFVSVNAVAHGVHLIEKSPTTRIAAIGKATAAALKETALPADIVPEAGFNSEALLAHPDLTLADGAKVLIVRGSGGRELMQETFAARGLIVETRDVYQRIRPSIDDATRDALETRWQNEGIDVVTATSIETLHNLIGMLSERGRALLRETTLLVASRRIADAAVGCWA